LKKCQNNDLDNYNICNWRTNRNADIAVVQYSSGGVFKGCFGQMTCIVVGTTATTPTPISTNVYIPDAVAGDYFEIHLAKATNAGETLTLQDLNWYINSN
jgi:hypothetical protein